MAKRILPHHVIETAIEKDLCIHHAARDTHYEILGIIDVTLGLTDIPFVIYMDVDKPALYMRSAVSMTGFTVSQRPIPNTHDIHDFETFKVKTGAWLTFETGKEHAAKAMRERRWRVYPE